MCLCITSLLWELFLSAVVDRDWLLCVPKSQLAIQPVSRARLDIEFLILSIRTYRVVQGGIVTGSYFGWTAFRRGDRPNNIPIYMFMLARVKTAPLIIVMIYAVGASRPDSRCPWPQTSRHSR